MISSTYVRSSNGNLNNQVKIYYKDNTLDVSLDFPICNKCSCELRRKFIYMNNKTDTHICNDCYNRLRTDNKTGCNNNNISIDSFVKSYPIIRKYPSFSVGGDKLIINRTLVEQEEVFDYICKSDIELANFILEHMDDTDETMLGKLGVDKFEFDL